MKKQNFKYRFLMVVLFMLTFVSTGCTVKSYTVLKERPDRETEGNRGYISGVVPEREDEGAKTRETYVFEVEFGQSSEAEQ